MTETARYGLPYLQAGQAQKEITHNDALARVDTLLHLAVDSRTSPSVPAVDGMWIVGPGAIGAWAGHDDQIAILDDAGWSFVTPRDGCVAFVRDETSFVHYRGGSWHSEWPVSSLSFAGGTVAAVVAPSGGSVIDVEMRAAFVQLLPILRRAGLVPT